MHSGPVPALAAGGLDEPLGDPLGARAAALCVLASSKAIELRFELEVRLSEPIVTIIE
jgi:hypothetical protein